MVRVGMGEYIQVKSTYSPRPEGRRQETLTQVGATLPKAPPAVNKQCLSVRKMNKSRLA